MGGVSCLFSIYNPHRGGVKGMKGGWTDRGVSCLFSFYNTQKRWKRRRRGVGWIGEYLVCSAFTIPIEDVENGVKEGGRIGEYLVCSASTIPIEEVENGVKRV